MIYHHSLSTYRNRSGNSLWQRGFAESLLFLSSLLFISIFFFSVLLIYKRENMAQISGSVATNFSENHNFSLSKSRQMIKELHDENLDNSRLSVSSKKIFDARMAQRVITLKYKLPKAFLAFLATHPRKKVSITSRSGDFAQLDHVSRIGANLNIKESHKESLKAQLRFEPKLSLEHVVSASTFTKSKKLKYALHLESLIHAGFKAPTISSIGPISIFKAFL